MDTLFILMALILGTVLGIFLGKLLSPNTNGDLSEQEKEKLKQLENQKITLDKSLAESQALLKQTKEDKQLKEEELQKLRGERLQLAQSVSALQTEKDNRQTLQIQFEERFKNLSQDILEAKSKQFQQQAEKNIHNLLTPVQTNLTDLQKKVEDYYVQTAKERHSLKDHIQALCDVHQQLKGETKHLSQALKGDVKAQGAWGELILSAVLDASGLKEGEHYTTQGRDLKLKDEEGRRQKPDIIVHLPDNKHIIIDSKVSLTHYESYISSDSEDTKQQFLSAFKNSLRTHVKNLSDKQYAQAVANTPDFVLMFFPIEGAFSLALQADRELFAFSWDKNIVIVSPTTLLATLKTIESIWKREKQSRYAEEIASTSGRLYDKFVGFIQDLQKVGDSLSHAENSYKQAFLKLRDGKGSIISRLEKIKQLGGKTTKQIPEKLISTEQDH